MTARGIVEEICRRYNAYEITTTSIIHAVLKPLRKHGLRGFKLDGKWVWYFSEEQLENFKKHHISELLRT